MSDGVDLERLAMPTECLRCDAGLLIPATDVVASALASSPADLYACPECGARLGVPLERLRSVCFFDREEYEAWDDATGPPPPHYHLDPVALGYSLPPASLN